MFDNPGLLASYRNGDSSAFLSLYERHATPLRRFLQGGFSFSSQGRICRFRGADMGMDVEALVQETFTRAFVKTTRENYDGIRPFQTYLFSIAKNLVLRECHYRERMVLMEPTDEGGEKDDFFSAQRESSIGDSPEKRMANKQLAALTQQFINELTAEERDYFSFRFAKGLTQETTAVKMGTTRARIKLLEKNVRVRFLEKLRSHGYFTDYSPNPRWKRQNGLDKLSQVG